MPINYILLINWRKFLSNSRQLMKYVIGINRKSPYLIEAVKICLLNFNQLYYYTLDKPEEE